MKVGSLFSGIGGFDLGLERAGYDICWQVEIDPYCQRVLAKHWPTVPRYGDICAMDWGTVEPVDVLCGGFPCQPFSLAGKRKGKKDDRALWPECVRALDVLKPTWFIGENVPGFITLGLEQACLDLEALNYEVWPVCLPACSVNAPHKRERLFIMAYSAGTRPQRHRNQCQLDESQGKMQTGWGNWWSCEPGIQRVAHGIPSRVDRLTAIGNAIVPQIAEALGRMILEVEP